MMTLSQVLQLAANMLDDPNLADVCKLDSSPGSSELNSKRQILISCVNQVCQLIATDYLTSTTTKWVNSASGSISLSALSNNGVINITWVKNSLGLKLDYDIVDNYLKTTPGRVQVRFAEYPKELTSMGQTIDTFGSRVSSRVMAYGVVAEYLFIKGNIDEASIWNERFKSGMLGVCRAKKNRIIKAQRWY